ncbi:hypothetical protein EDD37DRAFT_615844 [Exophiala viscosa]|uniref:Kinetochore protein Sos7 coiled-coil domain-containing protein n=1 Tax=Exophiala viscosa TaxID=2486360 RepID=A0AAN6DRC3_9EURO|nr:hypothetical protein EDD36DRAFT_318421 [Exophiala viscosa]KAI1629017.1 hypothetical protein EDD37DRAFT_615844 [Exophiala viscosa]
MAATDYATTLATLRAQQSAQSLSILALAEPITASQTLPPQLRNTQPRPADISSNNASDFESSLLTPASLTVDLAHYKDLFSKLRFSYLEQVTKEKYLRSIVGDPPLVVSHDDNLALEQKLAVMKIDLKAKKTEVDALVVEIQEQARVLAARYDAVNDGMQVLETVPTELERLQGEIEALKAEIMEKTGTEEGHTSNDPRMNMSLEATEMALAEQQAATAEIDAQIEALQRQMPGKVREVEKVDRELADLERRRNESTRLAMDGRRRREMGGRDEIEELGRWYRSSEAVLRGLLGVEG